MMRGAQGFAVVGVILLAACAAPAPAPETAVAVVDLERAVDGAPVPARDEGAKDGVPADGVPADEVPKAARRTSDEDLPAWFTTVRGRPRPKAPPPPPKPLPPVRELVVMGTLDLAPLAFQTVGVGEIGSAGGKWVVTDARGRFVITVPVRGPGSLEAVVYDGPAAGSRVASCSYDEATDRCEVSSFRRKPPPIDCFF